MSRLPLIAAPLLLLLLLLPGGAWAANLSSAGIVDSSAVIQRGSECFSAPSRAWLAPRHSRFSSATGAALEGLLRAWLGDWHGRMIAVSCLGAVSDPQIKVRRYQVTAQMRRALLSDVFEFDAELNEPEEGTRRRIWYWWLVKDDRLHFGDEREAIHHDRRWDVEVLRHVNNGFSFRRQYRARTRHGMSLTRLAVYALYGDGQSLTVRELFYTQGMLTGMRSWTLRTNQ